jgi:hypothetical protein
MPSAVILAREQSPQNGSEIELIKSTGECDYESTPEHTAHRKKIQEVIDQNAAECRQSIIDRGEYGIFMMENGEPVTENNHEELKPYSTPEIDSFRASFYGKLDELYAQSAGTVKKTETQKHPKKQREKNQQKEANICYQKRDKILTLIQENPGTLVPEKQLMHYFETQRLPNRKHDCQVLLKVIHPLIKNLSIREEHAHCNELTEKMLTEIEERVEEKLVATVTTTNPNMIGYTFQHPTFQHTKSSRYIWILDIDYQKVLNEEFNIDNIVTIRAVNRNNHRILRHSTYQYRPNREYSNPIRRIRTKRDLWFIEQNNKQERKQSLTSERMTKIIRLYNIDLRIPNNEVMQTLNNLAFLKTLQQWIDLKFNETVDKEKERCFSSQLDSNRPEKDSQSATEQNNAFVVKNVEIATNDQNRLLTEDQQSIELNERPIQESTEVKTEISTNMDEPTCSEPMESELQLIMDSCIDSVENSVENNEKLIMEEMLTDHSNWDVDDTTRVNCNRKDAFSKLFSQYKADTINIDMVWLISYTIGNDKGITIPLMKFREIAIWRQLVLKTETKNGFFIHVNLYQSRFSDDFVLVCHVEHKIILSNNHDLIMKRFEEEMPKIVKNNPTFVLRDRTTTEDHILPLIFAQSQQTLIEELKSNQQKWDAITIAHGKLETETISEELINDKDIIPDKIVLPNMLTTAMDDLCPDANTEQCENLSRFADQTPDAVKRHLGTTNFSIPQAITLYQLISYWLSKSNKKFAHVVKNYLEISRQLEPQYSAFMDPLKNAHHNIRHRIKGPNIFQKLCAETQQALSETNKKTVESMALEAPTVDCSDT